MLTAEDKQLLNRIQKNFPVHTSPFAIIGTELGMSEQEVLDRVAKLKKAGYIRRMGPFFNSQKLGYTSTLVALAVPEEKITEAANIINQYPGVTHNYVRSGVYNVWFTFIASSAERVQQALNNICEQTGLAEILVLPATHIFKVDVNLRIMEGKHD